MKINLLYFTSIIFDFYCVYMRYWFSVIYLFHLSIQFMSFYCMKKNFFVTFWVCSENLLKIFMMGIRKKWFADMRRIVWKVFGAFSDWCVEAFLVAQCLYKVRSQSRPRNCSNFCILVEFLCFFCIFFAVSSFPVIQTDTWSLKKSFFSFIINYKHMRTVPYR